MSIVSGKVMTRAELVELDLRCIEAKCSREEMLQREAKPPQESKKSKKSWSDKAAK